MVQGYKPVNIEDRNDDDDDNFVLQFNYRGGGNGSVVILTKTKGFSEERKREGAIKRKLQFKF